MMVTVSCSDRSRMTSADKSDAPLEEKAPRSTVSMPTSVPTALTSRDGLSPTRLKERFSRTGPARLRKGSIRLRGIGSSSAWYRSRMRETR
jgi:hypothetical protein